MLNPLPLGYRASVSSTCPQGMCHSGTTIARQSAHCRMPTVRQLWRHSFLVCELDHANVAHLTLAPGPLESTDRDVQVMDNRRNTAPLRVVYDANEPLRVQSAAGLPKSKPESARRHHC